MKKIVVKKIGDKSYQSNFDKRLSDFGSFLVTYLITTLLFMNTQMQCVMSNFLFLKNYHCKENTGIVFSCHEPMQYGISYYVWMRSLRYKLNICGVLSPDGLWQCGFSILVVGQNWNHTSHTWMAFSSHVPQKYALLGFPLKVLTNN